MEGSNAAQQEVQSSVKEYYGKVLKTTESLRTTACTTCAVPESIKEALKKVPKEVVEKYYGCGSPFPALLEGLNILDLGSGSGRDCYVLSQLTGPTGHITGVDMTEEQLAVARAHAAEYCTRTLGYPACNMSFVQGYIEDLEGCGVQRESQDLIISNCVVNLSPDKNAVLKSAFAVLKEGGEFFFSDVYCDRRLSDAVRAHPVLFGECLGGALYEHDFITLCKAVGFTDPREVSRSEIEVTDRELKELVGTARFFSITYRLFKLKDLEAYCEDYGQVAFYDGSIDGHANSYPLDGEHVLETNRPMLVCGNTAHMLQDTRLAPAFKIIGDKSTHFGPFDCSPKATTAASTATKTSSSGCC